MPVTAPNNEATRLHLADWRRTVAELYATVRRRSAFEPLTTLAHFRSVRDHLFRDHPQTPLTPEQRSSFAGLPYFPHQEQWRLTGTVEHLAQHETFQVQLPEGVLFYVRIADVHFSPPQSGADDGRARLSLYWIEAYGGGLFLPFKDATSGGETYGGGRYLYDGIKGADLGAHADHIVLDFNYAYNPSCAYNSNWVCPLAPPENTLPFPVPAGEKRLIRA